MDKAADPVDAERTFRIADVCGHRREAEAGRVPGQLSARFGLVWNSRRSRDRLSVMLSAGRPVVARVGTVDVRPDRPEHGMIAA